VHGTIGFDLWSTCPMDTNSDGQCDTGGCLSATSVGTYNNYMSLFLEHGSQDSPARGRTVDDQDFGRALPGQLLRIPVEQSARADHRLRGRGGCEHRLLRRHRFDGGTSPLPSHRPERC
jgi:hypothetical protein